MHTMRGVFGKWDWVANGVLFTLKHAYQRRLYPGLLVGGLSFAFAAGPLSSLPLAMVYHWVGNFLFQMVFLIVAALGVGLLCIGYRPTVNGGLCTRH